MNTVKLLKMYAPKLEQVEGMLYRTSWQEDPIPKAGIWETISMEDGDLFTLRCLAPWDERFPFMHTLKIRERLIVHFFNRVQLARTSLILRPNPSTNTEVRK